MGRLIRFPVKDRLQELARNLDLGPYLATEAVGRVVEVHARLPSTNDRALALAKEGAATGLLVVAMGQTAGRGQRGHRWLSPPGAGVYASFILRPRIPPRLAPALTLVVGVSLRNALQPILPVKLGLRWPNDLLVAESSHRGRKLAGVLLEAAADNQKIDHAVVGIGVNLSHVTLAPELDLFATSMEALGAEETGLAPVLGRIANALEEGIRSAETDGLGPASTAWSQHAMGLGEEVRFDDGERQHRGELMGIAEDGALLLRTVEGERRYYRGALEIPGLPRAPALSAG